ncbi:hypothetical protein V6N11_060987 [Hibiscus sabdariffa]|uniref:Uncharacterized protein n=1 Tax=Hibiscus sabdariffa TaxID=183260 RepID=A0ABR2QRX0_9ROSI
MGFDLESLAEAISGAIGSLEHLAVLWEAIANGVAAGACTVIITQISQPLDTAFSRMQTSEFGKSKGLWKTLFESSWSEAFDALDISLLLTTNPSIQYTVFDQLKQRLLKEAAKGENHYRFIFHRFFQPSPHLYWVQARSVTLRL